MKLLTKLEPTNIRDKHELGMELQQDPSLIGMIGWTMSLCAVAHPEWNHVPKLNSWDEVSWAFLARGWLVGQLQWRNIG